MQEKFTWLIIIAGVYCGWKLVTEETSEVSATPSGSALTFDGIKFPSELKVSGTSRALSLVGGGTRSKYGAVKVYGLGLYIDSHSATKPLKKVKSFRDLSFLSASSSKFSKTLMLQFHRSVGTDAVAGALNDALAKMISSESVGRFGDALHQVLPSGTVKGTKLFFICSAKADSIGVAVGAPSGGITLKDKSICPALLDVYFGKSPVSKAAKEDVIEGFANRLEL